MDKMLGLDVGGTGIKGAIVDLKKGKVISDRIKIATPKSKKPAEMIEVVKEIVNQFDWKGKAIGTGFPAVIKDGKSWTASNIDDDWIGFPVKKSLEKALGTKVSILNDADAAGLAEMKFGKGVGVDGTVILLTLGTGIGSAVFRDRKLLPNTEFGHLFYKDSIAEKHASNSARKKYDLNWEEYGKELNRFLEHVQFIFSPDLLILGGGISKKFDEYKKYFNKDINVAPAAKLNNAGIIGAAIWAQKQFK